eukprot:TRINITY_DN704_c0_g2_i1.p1 TRINITY_DN704_c0_g2~~TRINITY_DN704_c0_g2_i1.p1  ORF type:complete len:166 (+),score=44.24 TRINITY_DN704_c0_g2_i1:30-527(+)
MCVVSTQSTGIFFLWYTFDNREPESPSIFKKKNSINTLTRTHAHTHSMATPAEIDELACTYAALILHDAGQSITASQINAIVAAAGVEVQPFWPNLFERVLKEKNLDELLLAAGTGGGGGGGSSAGASAPSGASSSGGGAATGDKEPEEEEKKESSEAMEFDLFG